jgi:hypothetical protein
MPAEDEWCAERLIIGSLDDHVEQRPRYRERFSANDVPLRAREAGLPQQQVLDATPLFGAVQPATAGCVTARCR